MYTSMLDLIFDMYIEKFTLLFLLLSVAQGVF